MPPFSLDDLCCFNRPRPLHTHRTMTSPSTSTSKKTIAIIGAGVSGLQAARTLLTHPTSAFYEVIILEARDRIGGRVNTKRQWGFPLDYGMYVARKVAYQAQISSTAPMEIH
jgi:monoamine oxidase